MSWEFHWCINTYVGVETLLKLLKKRVNFGRTILGDLSQKIPYAVLIIVVPICNNLFFYGIDHTIIGDISQQIHFVKLSTLV